LREKFVNHEGKRTLKVYTSSLASRTGRM